MMKKQLFFLAGLFLQFSGLTAQTTYLSEDFEGGIVPAGWTAGGTWTVGTAAANSSSPYFVPPAHTSFALVNDFASANLNNNGVRFETPVIDLSAATSVFLKFDSYFHGYTLSSGNATEEAVIEYSTDGGTTWNSTSYTVPSSFDEIWQMGATNLTSQLAGQSNAKIAFKFSDFGYQFVGWALDNVTVFEPAPYEAALTVLTPANASPSAYGAVNGQVTLSGTILNQGASNITSFDAKYSDGTNTWTATISPVNIPPFTSYDFTHSVPYTIPALGPNPLTMWIELAGDNDHSNDTMNTSITGVSFMPVHHVTVEEATGTWCGFCVRGIVFMDSLNQLHPNTTELIAVHNGDPMVNSTYDNAIGGLIAGYPSTLCERATVNDPSDIIEYYDNNINNFGYADLTPTVAFNSSTRNCQVDISAHFAAALNGDYRLAVVFTEDHVSGTTSTWAQHNYYSGGGFGPMGGFENMPDPVPAAQMQYDFVARNISGGFNGQAGSLPAAIADGSTHTYTFNYTIPASYNVSNMRIHVLLIDNTSGTKRILNAAGAAIPLGVNEQTGSVAQMLLYPNPSNNGYVNLNYTLAAADAPVVEVVDALGRVVITEKLGNQASGDYSYVLNTSALAGGMYVVRMSTGTGYMSRTFQVNE